MGVGWDEGACVVVCIGGDCSSVLAVAGHAPATDMCSCLPCRHLCAAGGAAAAGGPSAFGAGGGERPAEQRAGPAHPCRLNLSLLVAAQHLPGWAGRKGGRVGGLFMLVF